MWSIQYVIKTYCYSGRRDSIQERDLQKIQIREGRYIKTESNRNRKGQREKWK